MQRHKLGEMPIFKGETSNVNNVNSVNICWSQLVRNCRSSFVL